jgi:2-oxoglutarate ferredoxin oxidoreductase subunit alpha
MSDQNRKDQKKVETLKDVTIFFAGDSGDGMQTVGGQLTNTSAIFGNDVSTLPDFPAEIRAPAGSLAGISGFQVRFSSQDIHTPGDEYDVIVATNPAALKVSLDSLKPNGIIIVNLNSFEDRDLKLAGYKTNPLEDGSLSKYQVFPVELTRLTREALKELNLSLKFVDINKNFFSLGMVFYLFNRPMEHTINWVKNYYQKRPQFIEPILRALKAGYAYCEATELFATTYEVKPATLPPGKYRNVEGNVATVLGMIAAAQKSGLPLFLAGYPITPASPILEEIAKYRNFGAKSLQAEDEIASVCMAIGAAYGGALAFTVTSGPGMALKSEAINLAVSVELPLVICDIQRAGPSTGMPTKMEQGDLLQALYGRNAESPIAVLAASRPSDCFETIYEACRIAIKYMTPVIFLSDAYLAEGAEPWMIPEVDKLPEIPVHFRTDPEGFAPFIRDPQTLARPWVKLGTPGLEHRIGGLEKEHITGNISYDPENHELMVRLRAEKVECIAQDLPPTKVEGDEEGELLIIGWGSTYGSIKGAVEQKRAEGKSVSHLHLRYLNPLPPDLEGILKRFKKILIPENNLGQLLKVIRAKYLAPAVGLHKVQGLPFKVSEIEKKIDEILEDSKL